MDRDTAKDDIVAREKSYRYKVAKDPEAPISSEPWQIQIQYNSGGTWESALMGHYKTKEEALRNFAKRHSGFTESLLDVETDNPYIKEGIDALFKERDEREAKRIAEEKQRQDDYNRQNAYAAELNKEFAKVHFKNEKTKIAGENGSLLPEEMGLTVGGLTITTSGEGKWKDYNITHQKSGLLIVDGFKSQKDAKMAAWRLSQLIDWTQSADVVKSIIPKGFAAFRQALRQDSYTELPKELESTKPSKSDESGKSKQSVIMRILPDGTLWIAKSDDHTSVVASWNPANRPDMTAMSRVGGYIGGEKVTGITGSSKDWLDVVSEKYDLDTSQIVSESWHGGGMIHKTSPYEFVKSAKSSKVSVTGESKLQSIEPINNNPNVVKVGVDDYEKMNKENTSNPNWDAANAEFSKRAKIIEDDHDEAVKVLNKDWSDSFSAGAKSKPIAYHERSDINTRKYYSALVGLRLDIHKKYGLSDVPVSDYEHKLWLEDKDPRTKQIDKLAIARDTAYDHFDKALLDDIDNAGGPDNLRYDKEGELDRFSKRTQNLYKALKGVDKKLAELRVGWPSDNLEEPKTISKSRVSIPSESKLQSVELSRSDRSRESDERQSNADTIDQDDSRVSQWMKDPGRMDVQGIDTPTKKKAKKSRSKQRRGADNPTSVRGIRR